MAIKRSDPRLEPLDDRLADQIANVTGKRPLTVIEHILEHGQITTEDLKETYGYNHPPRAIRDVRENGVPLDTFKVKGSDGRSIGAYRFGDPDKIEEHKLGGRKVFSKEFVDTLYAKQDGRCAITGETYEKRYLQVDHRVPYQVAGDDVSDESSPDDFMLVSGAANRQKSWSCEHCANWKGAKDPAVCARCYWASPEDYDHVAMREERRADITWSGDRVAEYERLKASAARVGKSIGEYIRDRLRGD